MPELLKTLLDQLGESSWWALPPAQREALERAIAAIVAYYLGNQALLMALIETAHERGYTESPLVLALCWRIREEYRE